MGKLLDDQEYQRYLNMDMDEWSKLTNEQKEQFAQTANAKGEGKFDMNSADGVIIGGKTLDEIAEMGGES